MAFPDQHTTLEDQIAEGDQVVTRSTFRGTHRADLMGISATGKAVTLPQLNIPAWSTARLWRCGRCGTNSG